VPDAEVFPSTSVDWGKVVRGETVIKMRQLPNQYNSMGKAKFEFPNPEGIYLHDTPEREYLAREDRHLSNGCIRLEDYARLGRWLMGGPMPNVGSAPEQKVDLPTPVPIYITYLTAQPEGGQLAVRSDPYGLDSGAPQTAPRPELALGPE
jgi:murein L,D-transpeptidase YcbB/YkuD